MRVWDVKSGTQLQVFKGHTSTIWSVSFSGDGTKVASGGDDKTVRVWDITSGAQLQAFKGHTGSIWGVSFSRDGTQVASGSDDHTVRLLELDMDQDFHLQLHVRWIAGQPALSLTDADFRGATGLSAQQRRLIQQHGGCIAE